MWAAICSWRVLTNLIVEPLSAARTAMLVWPQRPNRYSTPRPSRYLTSWCEMSCFMGSASLGIQGPRPGPCVSIGNVGRHRPLDSPALPRLLPGVGQDADRARQDEDA